MRDGVVPLEAERLSHVELNDPVHAAMTPALVAMARFWEGELVVVEPTKASEVGAGVNAALATTSVTITVVDGFCAPGEEIVRCPV